MSINTSTLRLVLRAAGWMLWTLLLTGCFLHGDVPLQPVPPPPASHHPAEKGSAGEVKPNRPAAGETAAADKSKPVGARELLLHGGWYRIPMVSEGSAEGVYQDAVIKQEKTSPETSGFRYRHAGLEELMSRPAPERAALPGLVADHDRNVAATAAIALARQGEANVAGRLIAAIDDPELSLPARLAAGEALGQLPGDAQVGTLRRLADRYGQYTPGVTTGYQADLHAELLRALARHIDAADDPRFIAAAQVPSVFVRIETLRAWAAGTRGLLPGEIVDLRSDDDPRVRAAALATLAARKHPAACDFLTAGVRDLDLSVRLAAIRGLGKLDDGQAHAVLADLLKDRSELIRAGAVEAVAYQGSRAVVLGVVADRSWRVRLKVAEALAAFSDREGAAAARRLLDDPSRPTSSGKSFVRWANGLGKWPVPCSWTP